MTGQVGELDFPTTSNAYQSSCSGSTFCNSTSFITVLDPSQSGVSSLSYSTFIFDGAQTGGIAVDTGKHIYVAGIPVPNGIVTTPGAYRTACPNESAFNCGFFVTKLDTISPLAVSSSIQPMLAEPRPSRARATLQINSV